MKTTKDRNKKEKAATTQSQAPLEQRDAPVLTPELIAQLRSAESVEAGLKLLQPDASSKAKTDVTYELNPSCANPFPQKRGVCLKVVAAAVRLNRPFKITDIQAALPDVKSAPFWTRKLAKTGHLVEV